MLKRLRALSRDFKRELAIYRLVVKDERTPRLSKILLGAAIGYLLLPFDLIPDAIPVLGQMDDALIVPGLVWLALQQIPPDVIEKCREAVQMSLET